MAYYRNEGGFIEEYYDGDLDDGYCKSDILLPGLTLQSTRTLATLYLVMLAYLFLGISIVADIFMEAIE